jgi:hypothetical protein
MDLTEVFEQILVRKGGSRGIGLRILDLDIDID